MGLWDGYDPTKEGGKPIEAGDHRVKLVKCEQRTSRAGNEMLAMELQTADGHKFLYSIVAGEYFSQKINAFYDAFGIQRGNQNIQSWIGKVGTAHVDLEREKVDQYGNPDPSAKRYMEIKYFIVQTAPQKPAQNAYNTAPNAQNVAGYGNRPQNAPQAQQMAYQGNQELDRAANAGWNDGFQSDVPYAGGKNQRAPQPQTDIF